MRRRPASSLAANPVLIGAVTVLVVVVAVYLSYNAQNGLPFAPAYTIHAVVPSAANLVHGDDVRIGGARVGEVSAIHVRPGRPARATLTLKLETSVRPLPTDTTVLIRAQSSLGLKYVELSRGHAAGGIRAGGTLPLVQARPHPVELDEVLNMFGARTRQAERSNLETFGDALAGQGDDLNAAIANLPRLLSVLEPVMANLSAPQTELARFFRALDATARQLVPVADRQADLYAGIDATFTALAQVTRPIAQSITEGVPALRAAIRVLPGQRRLLRNVGELFHRLTPGFADLRAAAPELAATVTVGTPALRRSSALNRRLAAALRTLEGFARAPEVHLGIGDLTDTAALLDPTISFLAPAQSRCNYLATWFRNAASVLGEGGPTGTWQRFIIVSTPQAPQSESGPSSRPGNGPPGHGLASSNYLHVNPYPNTAAPGQPAECEAGNEPYLQGRPVLSNVPGNQGTLHDPR
jgi:virulence factor Mce-like protein